MEMEDLAVCWLGGKSTLFRNAWHMSPVCSLFAMRLFDKALKLRAQGSMWTTQLSVSYA
jgi:hypothetical protein